MRKYSALLFMLLVGLAGAGCDSNNNDDNEPTIQEKLAGTWAVVGVADDDGDQGAALVSGFNSIVITFKSATEFSINVDAKDDAQDQVLSGSYSVTESAKRVTLTAQVTGLGAVPLNFTYAFTNTDDSAATFTADATTSTLLNTLLGTTLNGNVIFTLAKQS